MPGVDSAAAGAVAGPVLTSSAAAWTPLLGAGAAALAAPAGRGFSRTVRLSPLAMPMLATVASADSCTALKHAHVDEQWQRWYACMRCCLSMQQGQQQRCWHRWGQQQQHNSAMRDHSSCCSGWLHVSPARAWEGSPPAAPAALARCCSAAAPAVAVPHRSMHPLPAGTQWRGLQGA